MAKTSNDLAVTLGMLGGLSPRQRDARDKYRDLTGQRDRLIRTARGEGAPLQQLADVSGLSIAQVQRICDLSKGPGYNAQRQAEWKAAEAWYESASREAGEADRAKLSPEATADVDAAAQDIGKAYARRDDLSKDRGTE